MTTDFKSSYECEVDPEYPGDGEWGLPTYVFSRERSTGPIRGTPLVVRVRRNDGVTWVGSVEPGGVGGATGAFACPNPDEMCLVHGGDAFLIDTRRPEAHQLLPQHVRFVRSFEGLGLLLLASETDMTAIGANGFRWKTARLCLDELRIVSATESAIVCAGSFLDRDETLVLDPESGRLISGPRCPY